MPVNDKSDAKEPTQTQPWWFTFTALPNGSMQMKVALLDGRFFEGGIEPELWQDIKTAGDQALAAAEHLAVWTKLLE